MKLKIMIPTEILVDREVTKVVAEAENGYFCLLPHHIDFVATLRPGLFSFEDESSNEQVMALDRGVLVKVGEEVLVSAENAILGENLEKLQQAVSDQFQSADDRERRARSVLARMEADFINQFIKMQDDSSIAQ